LIIFACFSLLFAAPGYQEPIVAEVGMDRPEHHFYHVEITFPPSDKELRELEMAVWTPGSYKVRDFARNVERFTPVDLEDRPLEWVKTDKSTWVVNVPAGEPFRVRYDVFAYEHTVRTSYLDSFYGFINPASVFLYQADLISRPYEVRVAPPSGWSADSALIRRGVNVFIARDWDELVDSPFLFGELRRHEFEVSDIPHAWLIVGDINMNVPEMVKALQTMAETVGELFGGFPFERYHILSAFRLDGAGGGLEHINSTMVHGTSDVFRDKKGWDRFLGLMFHEYFHAWNVKAIRDRPLGPFDYQKENYTDLLWVHEGWTSYYDTLLMARAGFWSAKELRKEFAKMVDRYNRRPGVREQSLRDASFNAWIHQYQPTETATNSRISYYSGGAMSGLALDLLIRNKTQNERSLDDVMRLLYTEYAVKGRPVDYASVREVVSGVMGEDANAFFETHIANPNPFDWETLLGYAGLTMSYEKKKDEDGEDGDDEEKPYAPNPEVTMGIETRKREGRVLVDVVLRDSPAWQAGLDYGDEILAINDRRVTERSYDRLLGWSRPGDEIRVLVSRANKILEIPVKLEAEREPLRLVPDENADELAGKIYASMFDPNGKEGP